MVRTRIPLILGLLLALLGSAGTTSSARAAVTISVSPSLAELDATAGGSGELAITVFNHGDEPFSAAAAVQDHPQAPAERSARSWLRVEPAGIDVAPGQQQSFRVAIQVPSSVQSGGHYAVVAFR